MSSLVFTSLMAAVLVVGFGIYDVFSFGSHQWQQAGRSRPKWIALFFGFGPLAVLLYWGTVRYQLRFPERYETAAEAGPSEQS